ncbi:hypothetical protein DRP05_00880 [Archaeoglobales archaeon]|nr:MAG: hypothetical protein DRP05_00880 [Archaeoglobales archaeon]
MTFNYFSRRFSESRKSEHIIKIRAEITVYREKGVQEKEITEYKKEYKKSKEKSKQKSTLFITLLNTLFNTLFITLLGLRRKEYA